jgi:hypothetical protein
VKTATQLKKAILEYSIAVTREQLRLVDVKSEERTGAQELLKNAIESEKAIEQQGKTPASLLYKARIVQLTTDQYDCYDGRTWTKGLPAYGSVPSLRSCVRDLGWYDGGSRGELGDSTPEPEVWCPRLVTVVFWALEPTKQLEDKIFKTDRAAEAIASMREIWRTSTPIYFDEIDSLVDDTKTDLTGIYCDSETNRQIINKAITQKVRKR